jgi:hypothetical protein
MGRRTVPRVAFDAETQPDIRLGGGNSDNREDVSIPSGVSDSLVGQ